MLFSHLGTPFSDGKVSGLWFTGNTVYTVRMTITIDLLHYSHLPQATVITVILKAGLHIYHWDVVSQHTVLPPR